MSSGMGWSDNQYYPIAFCTIQYVYIYIERDVYMAYNNVYIHIVCHVISINIDMSDMYIQYSTERWALLDQPPHQVPHVHWPQIVDSITDFQCWLLGRQSLKSKRSPSECWCLQYMLHLTASSIIQCHPTQSHGQIIRNSSHGCHHQSLRWILAAPLLRSRVAGPRIPGTPRHWAGLPLTAIKARPVQWNWYMKKIYGLRKKNMWSLRPMILTHKYHKCSFRSIIHNVEILGCSPVLLNLISRGIPKAIEDHAHSLDCRLRLGASKKHFLESCAALTPLFLDRLHGKRNFGPRHLLIVGILVILPWWGALGLHGRNSISRKHLRSPQTPHFWCWHQSHAHDYHQSVGNLDPDFDPRLQIMVDWGLIHEVSFAEVCILNLVDSLEADASPANSAAAVITLVISSHSEYLFIAVSHYEITALWGPDDLAGSEDHTLHHPGPWELASEKSK